MPDIPSASAVSAVSATAAATSNNIVVETAVNSVPDKIAMLSRQIEVSGTLAQPPTGTTITINTLIGPLTLLLPQLAQMQQDKLLQQLMSLFQNQRPLTIVMQPGNPPSQAFLLLPPVTTPAQNAAGAYNAVQSPSAANIPPPLTPNLVLSAIVLPNNTDLPPSLQQTQGQAPLLPQLQTQTPAPPSIPGGVSSFNAGPALNPVTIPSIPASVMETLIKDSVLSSLEQQLPPNPIEPSGGAQNAPLAPFPALPPLPQGFPASALGAPLSPQVTTPPGVMQNMPLENFALAPVPSLPGPALPPASLTTLLQPGMELNLRVTAVINPQNPAPSLQPNQIIATVTGSGPGGQIILKADSNDATLFVRQPVSVPNGTQLVLTVDLAQQNAPDLVPLPNAMEFASLPQIFAAMAQMDPAALRQMIAARMPQPGEALPSTLLLFLSAVRDGDVRSWLGGDAADLLTRAGKAELITRLAQELQQTGQSSHDDVVGEWRSYAVPVLDNNHLAVFYLHIHGQQRRHGGGFGKQPENKTQPAQVRFVIDVRMSRLGAMQLDGFLRPQKLDIVMRSESRLPAWLDNELRQTYKRTLDAIGYNGGISFQSGRGNWVNIQKPATGGAVVT